MIELNDKLFKSFLVVDDFLEFFNVKRFVGSKFLNFQPVLIWRIMGSSNHDAFVYFLKYNRGISMTNYEQTCKSHS